MPGSLLLDDLLLVLLVPLTVVFVFAGPRTPVARAASLGWMAYYLLMIVVVFHNEIRYRSAFVPFACAAAAGGLATLADPTRRRRASTWAALAVGVLIVVGMLRPYAAAGWRDAAATRLMTGACRALDRGATDEAWRIAEQAAGRAPHSPRPWYDLGKALDFPGDAAGSLAAYAKGDPLGNFANWRGLLGRARLLPVLDAGDTAARAVRQADRASWDVDPWLVLEIAWRELPPPRTDEVLVARNDYGAVRGMFHPRGIDAANDRRSHWTRYEEGGVPPEGAHRWTRGRAWVRLLPTVAAAAYDVTVEMGSPFPSPNRGAGGDRARQRRRPSRASAECVDPAVHVPDRRRPFRRAAALALRQPRLEPAPVSPRIRGSASIASPCVPRLDPSCARARPDAIKRVPRRGPVAQW